MILNYILAVLAAVFFMLCIISVMSEASPSENARSRNLFRRLRITLREINAPVFVLFAVIVIYTAKKTELLDLAWSLCSLAAFAAGLVILNSFRIFGRLGSRRRKKSLRPLGWNSLTKEAKPTPEAKYTSELREAPASTELPERTAL